MRYFSQFFLFCFIGLSLSVYGLSTAQATAKKPIVKGYSYDFNARALEKEEHAKPAKNADISNTNTSRSSTRKKQSSSTPVDAKDFKEPQPQNRDNEQQRSNSDDSSANSDTEDSGQNDPNATLSAHHKDNLEDFKIYHQLSYRDMDDQDRQTLTNLGFDHIPLLTSWFFFPPNHDREDVDDAVRERVIHHAQTRMEDGKKYVLDIEHWSTGAWETAETRAESVRKMIEIIEIIRGVHPNVILGYYSMVPGRNYWAVHENCLGNRTHQDWIDECTRREQEWHDANTELLPLAEAVDFIAPSIYTFYNKPDAWVSYAIANLREAKRIAGLAGNKPVYAYIWPRYHGSNNQGLAYRPIDGEFWSRQLTVVAKMRLNGVIFWDSAQWVSLDDVMQDEEWFDETLNFLGHFADHQ